MPDAMEKIFQAALDFGKHGGVSIFFQLPYLAFLHDLLFSFGNKWLYMCNVSWHAISYFCTLFGLLLTSWHFVDSLDINFILQKVSVRLRMPIISALG